MREGAMGVGSSLIYAPAFYAKTPELIALCQVAAPFGGMYISAPSQRRQSIPRGAGRVHHHLARSEHPRRDLPPQSGRHGELAQDGRGFRGRSSRRGSKVPDHRRHVPVYGGRHRTGRRHAPMGSGRRRSRPGSSGSRTRRSAPESSMKCGTGQRLGEPDVPRRGRRHAPARFPQSRTPPVSGQDSRRSRQTARQVASGDRPRPRDRGPQSRRTLPTS